MAKNRYAHYPYVSIRCPYTSETVMVKETVSGWSYGGKTFHQLDDILDERKRQVEGEVTTSKEKPKKKNRPGPRARRAAKEREES